MDTLTDFTFRRELPSNGQDAGVRKIVVSAIVRSACCWFLLLSISGAQESSNRKRDTIKVSADLVVVPASVQRETEAVGRTLTASDFRLIDNGVPQHLSIRSDETGPLAVELLLQTGASAQQEFEYFQGLPAMLDNLAGDTPHRISFITFDSEPETETDFVPDASGFAAQIRTPKAGNRGAAILDALMEGLDHFDEQKPPGQRVILLLSQPYDIGSKTKLQDVIRRLGSTNTAIFSVTFSPARTWLKGQFTKPRHEQPYYRMSPDYPPLLHTFDLGTPLKIALTAMRDNTAAEIASLSGGESFSFTNRKTLEQSLLEMANRIPNRYQLSFTPSEKTEGYHKLEISLPQYPAVRISARSAYWLSSDH